MKNLMAWELFDQLRRWQEELKPKLWKLQVSSFCPSNMIHILNPASAGCFLTEDLGKYDRVLVVPSEFVAKKARRAFNQLGVEFDG